MKKVMEAFHAILFSSSELAAIVENNIYEAKGPPVATWPLVHYFEVASGSGYLLDYNDITVQFSCYATDQFTARNIQDIIHRLLHRYSGTITTYYGDVEINHTEDLGSNLIETPDPHLFGYQLRYLFRYRGANIGG